ncbi:hypothetical protein LTR10_004123 [Elasticomyces elasticus]|nr:hypothetical protein LTR10_004123 [Elasticomyces elasticus]KAK4977692.1 hypothetical protein LTR42_002064 [Elasticomyces elasticus]
MSEEIPKKGKAAVVVNEGPEFRVEVQEVDVPEPSMFLETLSDQVQEDDEVLLRLNATGLCMSDVQRQTHASTVPHELTRDSCSFMMNDWAVPPMSHFGTTCAGHEGAGVVVKVGSKVTKMNNRLKEAPPNSIAEIGKLETVEV